MPTIRVSQVTYDALKGLAEPFEDTPDAVIARLLERLGHLPRHEEPARTTRVSPPETSSNERTPQSSFREPLIHALEELGGKATKAQVCELVPKYLSTDLKDGDYTEVSSGEPRWVNAVAWERKVLVDEGILRDDSPRGVWELAST